jgi:hypothetical protein
MGCFEALFAGQKHYGVSDGEILRQLFIFLKKISVGLSGFSWRYAVQ